MVRTTRLGILLLLATGCHKSAPEPPAAARFLPSTAEIAIRVDLTRARAWSGYAKAAEVVFRSLHEPVEIVKKACDVDLLGAASSIVIARRGAGATGDMTLVIGGLPKDKLAACPGKLGSTIPGLEIIPDGDLFGVKVAGRAFGSGAILPGGELVLVSRAASSVEPAAWRQEVTAGGGAAPAWWAELDQVQPLAIRAETPERTITANAEIGDPFVIHGKIVSASAELAAGDLARAKAIVDFLTKADAGTGRLEPRELTLHGDFTAKGAQVDHLVAAGLSTIGGDDPAAAPPVKVDDSPIACTELGGAVATYMATNVEAMPPDQRTATAPVLEKLLPALQKAYVDSCTADAWSPTAIHCHVDNAKNLPRFEKCRLVLTPDQRTKFDGLVSAALAAAK